MIPLCGRALTAGAFSVTASLFPMLQVRHHGLHVGADLLRRPALAGHVRHAEVDELLLTGIRERAVGIAPFAVLLVEGAIRLPAGGGILQRHPAALADQLPRRAQQRVDGDIKQPGKLLQCLRIRRGLAVFPAGHRLSGDKQLLRQLIL